jgi:hypothetical protein
LVLQANHILTKSSKKELEYVQLNTEINLKGIILKLRLNLNLTELKEPSTLLHKQQQLVTTFHFLQWGQVCNLKNVNPERYPKINEYINALITYW